MPINILHVSDLHFGSDHLVYGEEQIRIALVNLVRTIDDDNIFLLISGDITFQGRSEGFETANVFFDMLIRETNISREKILICPGNHDITRQNNLFYYFDNFSYHLRRDELFTFSKRDCVLQIRDDIVFLGINTLSKYDHKFGFVNISELEEILRSDRFSDNHVRVAFLHHHLINQFETDISVLRNAYPLLVLLDEYNFEFIFHGHQHSDQVMPIGHSKMMIFGVRSFNYHTAGYVNGVNHYLINENELQVNKYIYIQDSKGAGKIGNFIRSESLSVGRNK